MSTASYVSVKNSNLHNLLFILIGMIVLSLHVGLYLWSPTAFYVIVSIYSISYITFLLILTNSLKVMTVAQQNLVFYPSMMLIGLELAMIFLSLFKRSGGSSSSSSSYGYASSRPSNPYGYDRYGANNL